MHSGFVTAGGHRLEYQLIPAHQINRPTLVLLHEGLGSVAMWRDFPSRLAAATGCRTLVYSRCGYGQSDLPEAPFGADYMHREGRDTLPEVLAALDIEHPVLVGHSDGASIALLHAGAGNRVAGLVVLAPHCFVEDLSIYGITAARLAFETTDLPAKLGKYHRDVNRSFGLWNEIWLHPDFRAWNIEDCLPGIACPILAIQGEDDEYGTMAQIEAIASGATGSPGVELLKLADCRHSAHKDQTVAVIEAINRFAERLDPGSARGATS
jgi:pimeloyl-ACP methyl ester carboxylesterase